MRVILLGTFFLFSFYQNLKSQGLESTVDQDYYNDLSSEPDTILLKQRVSERIVDFQQFVESISSKENPPEVIEYNINRAMKLFVKDATIEVSSLKRPQQVTEYKAREYLVRLSKLNYFKVEIKYGDFQVGNVSYLGDKVYVISGTIFQSFRGIDKHGNVVYKDITIKKIDIICVLEQRPELYQDWKLKFQRIIVVDTQ